MKRSLKHKNVSYVSESCLCHACGACAVCCPRHAINYRESVGGYILPKIDQKKCSGCGLCYQVCPSLKTGRTLTTLIPHDPFVGEILSCEAGKATDEVIFKNGQSGGVLTALLTHLFVSKQIEAALVVAMPEGTPPRAEAIIATSPSDLIAAQKSKYSSVPILQALRDLGRFKGRVAVVGTACRFHGLHNLLDTMPGLLHQLPIKLGLICDRVMTSAAIDFLGAQATTSPINQLIWRDKQSPCYPGNPVIYSSQGDKILLQAVQRMAIKDFFTPVRCRLCFDKLNVFADVVFGDPHGIKDIDRVGGETLVIVRTEIGRKIVNSVKDDGAVILHAVPKAAAVEGQGIAQKRIGWGNFLKSWQEIGGISPNFPFSPDIIHGSSLRYRKLLEQGLMLDKFNNRNEVLTAAKAWLFRQKIKSIAFRLLRKIKFLMREENNVR